MMPLRQPITRGHHLWRPGSSTTHLVVNGYPAGILHCLSRMIYRAGKWLKVRKVPIIITGVCASAARIRESGCSSPSWWWISSLASPIDVDPKHNSATVALNEVPSTCRIPWIPAGPSPSCTVSGKKPQSAGAGGLGGFSRNALPSLTKRLVVGNPVRGQTASRCACRRHLHQ